MDYVTFDDVEDAFLDPNLFRSLINIESIELRGPSANPAPAPFQAIMEARLTEASAKRDVLCYMVRIQQLTHMQLKAVRRIARLLLDATDSNLLQYIGAGYTADHIFVVMERTDAGTLRPRLITGQQVELAASLKFLLDVAKGMKYLHANGIIHRMLTAAHIHITKSGCAKVGDFGFSREIGTHAMTNIGIPHHAAPEILRGATEYTNKVDVYSFAMLIVEVVTRQEPYANVDATAAEILDCIAWRNYRPVFERPAAWPVSLFMLMEQCWHVNPEERPSSENIVERLESIHAAVAA